MTVNETITWTDGELVCFDQLVENQTSRDGKSRLEAFEKVHGREKCGAMFAHLESMSKSANRNAVKNENKPIRPRFKKRIEAFMRDLQSANTPARSDPEGLGEDRAIAEWNKPK
jgi:hypothetical protein